MSKIVQLISKNCGKITPDSINEYIGVGGYGGLKKAITMKPIDIIEEIKKSKLRGRGGAAYPCGSKWEHLLHIEHGPKYIVCNADEGEPGTFKDKLLLSENPLLVIEGMTIAGYTFGSKDGYIYIRGEYLDIQRSFQNAIDNAVAEGYLGNNILGTGFEYNIHIVSGAGAYVCGENSALLNSIEGKPGRPRIKPPHLAEVGLFGKPTLVNNVETFSFIPIILRDGAESITRYGTEESKGTKLVCLSGNVVNRGVYEVPFGITLRELIYDIGGGIPSGRKFKMGHIGGSSGLCFSEEQLDLKLCYTDLKNHGLGIGSGAIVVLDDSQCVIDYLKATTEFFIHESCGKCTPCREGNRQMHILLSKFEEGTALKEDINIMKQLGNTMTFGSFCGLGQTAAKAVLSCHKYFMNEFEEHIYKKCNAGICKFGEGEV
jgi:NADH-quinone oxidoreductase subunit F